MLKHYHGAQECTDGLMKQQSPENSVYSYRTRPFNLWEINVCCHKYQNDWSLPPLIVHGNTYCQQPFG